MFAISGPDLRQIEIAKTRKGENAKGEEPRRHEGHNEHKGRERQGSSNPLNPIVPFFVSFVPFVSFVFMSEFRVFALSWTLAI
jgi:hypothetical protein